ncbi:hypothetical protein CAI21_03265 [Alkalilimnicola ehrlichii]|uniref:MaoC-like domain-containing protein n=1 Tax=Alkalilimnicola ehrlichii TaxID=351052 RepID=A0A3E0X108_9GAMM|nr:MaoC/PaaZ C-terminal domain-containing protein [Alkalilimnicola ehrlichii]RFA31005.1 hypothetical protein CAI21_03265 [Alkalilimnicola ehrlichii]RFA38958.1 hypothetical protein CAL65_03410 [Alkalilimnicola ehrlichii]
MNEPVASLIFKRMPSPTSGYIKAALARRHAGSEPIIPPLEAHLPGVRPHNGQVRRYAELCGYQDRSVLPLAFPHVLAAPLHLAILTHNRFPYRLLGAVHVRNSVHQQRAIGLEETLSIWVGVNGQREVRNGIEFDLETRIKDVSNDVVWHSVSTNLIRGKSRNSDGPGWTPPELASYQAVDDWRLPSHLGRRYGRLAGDINPIHLYPLTAKLFGFQRHIAHGMWTFSRCVAALSGATAPQRAEVTVTFRKPVFLPSRVCLYANRYGRHTDYALTDTAREVFHLTGTLKV